MRDPTVKLLKYGNTNSYFVSGTGKGILIDTDMAGTLPAFWGEIKYNNIKNEDIGFLLITHFHPDHMGIAGELSMRLGVKPLIVDVQRDHIHDSDKIFRRCGANFVPIDENNAVYVSCAESRDFLNGLGISGEIIHTPGHSPDSVSLILDSGDAFVGDMPPLDVIGGFGDDALKASRRLILSYHPKIVHYGHANDQYL